MKKQFLLSLLLCLFVALPGRSQLAVVIDSTVHRGTLFTNGTTLYEIYNDTISSLNAATGSRTLLYKLPSFLPPGATTAKWGRRYNIKTANGFITTCDYNTSSASYKIWSYSGSSWDTILAPYYNWTPQSAPVQVGADYIYCFTKPNANNSTTVVILKTDGTNAGTQLLLQATYPTKQLQVYFPSYRNSTPALFSIQHLDGYTSTAKLRFKIGVADNAGARLIDSSEYTMYELALLANTLYYVNGLSGSPSYSYEVNTYNLGTGARTNFIGATTDFYNVGIGFKNKIITSRLSAPYDRTVQEKLISIDPATGVQMLLADSLSYYAPDRNISEAVAGTNHLFIPFNPNSAFTTMFNSKYLLTTDGITSGSKPNIHLSNAIQFGLARSSFELSYGGVCQDELYFSSKYSGGLARDLRLYRLTGNNTLDSQITCITPYSFVKVNGTMYFLARVRTNTVTNSLWKITACTEPASVSNAPEEVFQAVLYPNPAHTAITVSLPGAVSVATLDLYDATGRCLLSQSVQPQQSVSTVHLPNGLYIYRITAPNGALLISNRLSIIH